MGLLDVKIEVSGSRWRGRNQRLERLKSVVVRSSSQPSTDNISGATATSSSQLGNGEIPPADSSTEMPEKLYCAAAENDVDTLIGTIEEVSTEKELAFSDILQLVGPSGDTLLHVAVISDCIENVKLLLYHAPALILKQNLVGDTPLHLAVRTGDYNVNYAFMDFLGYKRSSGFQKKWIKVVGTIPELEKSVRIRNSSGNTPLHEAVVQPYNYETFATFVYVDPEVCYFLNNKGKSPLQLAAEAEKQDYVTFMLGHLKEIGLKEPRPKERPSLIPVVRKSNEDVKIEVSGPSWRGRNQRLEILKSSAVTISANSTSSSELGNGEIHPTDPSPVVQRSYKGTTNMPEELYWAAAKNDADSLIGILEQVSAEKELAFSDILQLVSPSGDTLLHVAVNNNCRENVKLLLYHAPALLLIQNLVGDTPLHLAVRTGDRLMMYAFTDFLDYTKKSDFEEEWTKVVGMIPEMRNSLRVRNRNGNTPFHEAVIQPYYDTVATFVYDCPEVCYFLNNQGKSPLYLAVEADEEDYVSCMLHRLKEVGFKGQTPKGLSPLIPVVLQQNKDFIDKILKYEPRFHNLLDEDGKTPLHYAASFGCIHMVQYILGKSTEYAMVRDNNGFLPIHAAAAHGSVKVIRLFLKHCRSPVELLTLTGQNILHIAAANGKNNVLRFVLQTPSLECLINEGDIDGNTPLHLATINWRTKVVSDMTWDKKVDLGYVNKEGFTALDAAEYYMERPPTFDKRLTWTALKAAGAPTSQLRRLSYTSKSQPLSNTDMDNYKDRVNTLLVVATLVATVTFAAGFTMPGGYNNSDPNQGMATMLQNKVFYIFIFSDTIAMYTSILVAISLIWAQLGDINLVFIALRIAIPLLGAGLSMMSLAFMAGVYLVVSQLHWLAFTVLITGLTFLAALLLLFFPLCFPISSRCRVLRYFSYYPFQLLILVTSSADERIAD